jgi:hypothetical protein
MWSWLQNNAGTIVIGLLVVAVVAGLLWKQIRDKKQGKSSCGCGCEGCALRDKCHPKTDQK